MTGTVPRFLRCVPRHDASQMWTNSREFVDDARTIAEDGDFAQSLAEHRAGVGGNVVERTRFAAGDPVSVARGDVEVFADELLRRAQRLARRIVELGPGIVAAENEIGQQQAGDGAVRYAHAGIAGGDVDVVLVRWIAANEGQAVDWLHHLPRPAKQHRTHLRQALPRPQFQPLIALLLIERLPGLVVLAADDQQLFAVHVVGGSTVASGTGVSPVLRMQFFQA